MADTFDLDEELLIWAKEYGEEKTAKSGMIYYKFDYKNGKRARDIVALITKLKELGAEKDMFKGGPTRNAIIETALGPKHVYPVAKKYGRAVECTRIELDRAIVEVYGSESNYYKNNGTTRKLKVEKSELEKQYEAQQALEQQISHEQLKNELHSQSIPQDDDIDMISEGPYPPPPPRKLWKDTKKELIASGKLIEEPLDYQVDPDILALFGIKEDE